MNIIDANGLIKVKFNLPPYTHIVPVDLPNEQTEVYERGWNDAVDAIMECAETVEPPQWIPVSSGNLPEKYAPVIISIKDNVHDYVECGMMRSNEEWVTIDSILVNVTAWMPLPEPWKGSEA